jgi:hypothetical protein
MDLGMDYAVDMTAARARRGTERIQGNIEARGDSLRIRGVCCIGWKQMGFPLCCLDQMAQVSSAKITVS